MASVAAPVTNSGVTPRMIFGLPALPIPAILPSFTPTSALITPNIGSIIVTLVMTKSNVPPSEVVVFAKPIPSRKVLPPP